MRSYIHTGTYLAFLNSIAAIVQALIPPLGGSIIDSLGYEKLFILIVIVGILFIGLLTICALMVKQTQKQNQMLATFNANG